MTLPIIWARFALQPAERRDRQLPHGSPVDHRDSKLGDRRPGDPAALVGDAMKAPAVRGWQPCLNDLDEIVLTA